ncbi:hypothetical protein D3C80_1355350 [compost metagenome]
MRPPANLFFGQPDSRASSSSAHTMLQKRYYHPVESIESTLHPNGSHYLSSETIICFSSVMLSDYIICVVNVVTKLGIFQFLKLILPAQLYKALTVLVSRTKVRFSVNKPDVKLA